MTYKRQLQHEISELFCTIQHIKEGNEVVIERVYVRWAITIKDLINECNELITSYNKKYGKRFGSISLVQ